MLINTPERVALRVKIADEIYGDGAKNKNKRLDIVIGVPASGKSRLFAEPLAKKYGSLIIDADIAKKKLGKEEDSQSIHQESIDIVENDLLFRELIK